jgi:hypothetical protein
MASRSSKRAANTTISRDDLEQKFRGLQNNIRGAADERKQSALATGAGFAAVLLVIFFLLGKRSGRKKTTVVEIRRM